MSGKLKCFIGIFFAGCVLAASAQSEFPLRFDIDVSTKTDTRTIGSGDSGQAKVDMLQCRVKIRKSGGPENSGPLTAELYIIGQQIQTGYYGIMDVVKKSFTLDNKDENIFEFTTKDYPFAQTSGNINVGSRYETYLLVISDENGKVLETRSGRAIGKKGIERIRELGPMTLFDRDGHVVGKIEDPGAAFRAAVPAAVSSGSD